MSSDKDRHDYSLLASFMPKEEAEERRTIPVQLDVGLDLKNPQQTPVAEPKRDPEADEK